MVAVVSSGVIQQRLAVLLPNVLRRIDASGQVKLLLVKIAKLLRNGLSSAQAHDLAEQI